MRYPVMLAPLILTLLGSDVGSPLGVVRDTGSVVTGSLTPHLADTGNSLVVWGRYRSQRFAMVGDSNGLPRTECPMPVARPDPDASARMPTNGSHPMRDSVTFFSGPPANGSGMPVVRSGCWNPLDRPQGGADSAGKGGAPRR